MNDWKFDTSFFYNNDDEFCYVDFSSNSPLQPGDYVVKPESTERFQLGATATLDGVYNINKGYAIKYFAKK